VHWLSEVQVVGVIVPSPPHPAKPNAKPAAMAAANQMLVFVFIMSNVSLKLRW